MCHAQISGRPRASSGAARAWDTACGTWLTPTVRHRHRPCPTPPAPPRSASLSSRPARRATTTAAQTSPHDATRARGRAAPPLFPPAGQTLLGGFLTRCDLIQFARDDATTADSRSLLEEANRCVKGGALAPA